MPHLPAGMPAKGEACIHSVRAFLLHALFYSHMNNMSELEGFVKVSREHATPDAPDREVRFREDASRDTIEVS